MKQWRLLVGCPIRDRAWIIQRWSHHVERAVEVAEEAHDAHIDWEFVFVGDPGSDPETFSLIEQLQRPFRLIEVRENDGFPMQHAWHYDRYVHMAELRNLLLEEVRAVGPTFFWSLDSDILAHPQALESSIRILRLDSRQFSAVGQRCYMAPGGWCTNCAQLVATGGLLRENVEGIIPVDVIMAAKLMRPEAYDVDYAPHRQGEDIGWSINVRRQGLHLGWDGRFTSDHVMVRPPVSVP